MKKNIKRSTSKPKIDINLLMHWKSLSDKAKLNWLNDAIMFGKLKKF